MAHLPELNKNPLDGQTHIVGLIHAEHLIKCSWSKVEDIDRWAGISP